MLRSGGSSSARSFVARFGVEARHGGHGDEWYDGGDEEVGDGRERKGRWREKIVGTSAVVFMP